jgi:large repetitive protein
MKDRVNHSKMSIGFLTVFLSFLAIFAMCTHVYPGLIVADGVIGNFVWNDLNHNGIQDPGEPGIAGVLVELLDSNKGHLSSGYTSATGKYLFEITITSLQPSYNFIVRFTPPTGYSFTLPRQGSDRSKDSDPDSTGLSGVITLSVSGAISDSSIDAGMYVPRPLVSLPGLLLLLSD